MNKDLYLISIKLLKKAYNKPQNSIGSTQWSIFKTEYKKEPLTVLAIVGTNGFLDWFWNLLLLQKDGVKLGSFIAAKRIINNFIQIPNTNLLITCHSKSGPTGIYLQELLNADYCVAFEPARGFIYNKINTKTIVFIDKDDYVPKFGWIRFKHRKTKVIYLPKDKKWYDFIGKLKDHLLDHLENFINNMEDIK